MPPLSHQPLTANSFQGEMGLRELGFEQLLLQEYMNWFLWEALKSMHIVFYKVSNVFKGRTSFDVCFRGLVVSIHQKRQLHKTLGSRAWLGRTVHFTANQEAERKGKSVTPIRKQLRFISRDMLPLLQALNWIVHLREFNLVLSHLLGTGLLWFIQAKHSMKARIILFLPLLYPKDSGKHRTCLDLFLAFSESELQS